MTDFEAYQLMVKYKWDLQKIKLMVHSVGVDKAVEAMCNTSDKKVPNDVKLFMKQGFNYILNQSSQN